MRRAFCFVVVLAFAILLPRAVRVGMTGDYVDAIGRITAQDEALYGNSSIAMARSGHWLTPSVLGGSPFSTPPLLIWASALSAKLFGVARLSLRMPGLWIAALAVGVIFLWGAEAGEPAAGVCAAVFVLGNHIFHTLSTLVMADALLLACTSAALYAIYADPWLESRVAFWGYSAATAAAILSKGVAGLFPIAILALHWLAVRPQERPALSRAAQAIGLALGLSAPWFLFQLAVNPQWLSGHVAEILGFASGAPSQTPRENPFQFYLVRLVATDPILFSGAVVAIPSFVKILRSRKTGPILLACWLGLACALTLVWPYRSAAHILPLIPALALMAACYGPFAERQHLSWMLGLVCLGLVVKAALPNAPWGLNYRAGTVNPVANALTAYCEGSHARALIVMDAADDFYAALLPLGLQYVSVASPHELEALMRRSPDADFLIPDSYRAALPSPSHTYVMAAPGFGFLMATRANAASPRAWTCRM